MSERSVAERITFHEEREILEVDFSGLVFHGADEVNSFYDVIDARVDESGSRWYFLVNYENCTFEPEAWAAFAERGKHANISYGLGTVRFGVNVDVRESIRSHAQSAQFRANLFDSRDAALLALADMRKRHQTAGVRSAESFLKVEDILLRFGGVTALENVGFSVLPGEVFSIIGPNGAGKTSMLNVVSGFYRATSGRILFEGQDRTHLKTYEVAQLGFARTFQNIALFRGMSTLDNIMTGRLLKTKYNFVTDALYWGPAQKEEIKHREFVEHIIDFLEIQPIRRTPVGKLPYGLQKRVELARGLGDGAQGAAPRRADGGNEPRGEGGHGPLRPRRQGRVRNDGAADRARHERGHGHFEPRCGARPRSEDRRGNPGRGAQRPDRDSRLSRPGMSRDEPSGYANG